MRLQFIRFNHQVLWFVMVHIKEGFFGADVKVEETHNRCIKANERIRIVSAEQQCNVSA